MAEEDLIYGKKRHMFGGIAPGNMRAFRVLFDPLNKDYSVYIHWALPSDTVIDGQTLCSVEGVVIRRKEDGWPVDEFDGELVIDSTAPEGSFADSNASSLYDNYYYAAFPYSTQGVYNRNEANRDASYNMLTDVHIGGTNGPNYSDSELLAKNSKLWIVNTDEFTSRIIFMCNYADGCMIRRSDKGYPKSITDGELVYEGDKYMGTVDDQHNAYMSTTYYYTLFPLVECTNNQGVQSKYLYIDALRCSNFAGRRFNYLYGFDIDLEDPNPNTRVTYPEDVDNAAFEPAKMNFDVGVFEYGDWPSESKAHDNFYHNSFLPDPVMLSSDGVVKESLDNDDYSKLSSGSNSSYYNSATTSTYNAMMRWPRIYVKREIVNGVYRFRCSDGKIDSSYECICNYDKDNNNVDYFYTPIYEGYVYNSKLRSISGVTPTTSISPSQSATYASANGTRWTNEVLADRLLIQDLLILMAKTTDCQKAYGIGVCGNNSVINTGTMDKKGLFWGSKNPSEGVKVFGMENWWGNHSRYIAGLLTQNNKFYVKFTRGTKDGSTINGYTNSDVSKYIELNYGVTNSGYLRGTKLSTYGRLPYDSGGSSTTYEADNITKPESSSTVYYPAVGGNSEDSEGAIGPFALYFPMQGSAPNTTSTKNGASISYK